MDTKTTETTMQQRPEQAPARISPGFCSSSSIVSSSSHHSSVSVGLSFSSSSPQLLFKQVFSKLGVTSPRGGCCKLQQLFTNEPADVAVTDDASSETSQTISEDASLSSSLRVSKVADEPQSPKQQQRSLESLYAARKSPRQPSSPRTSPQQRTNSSPSRSDRCLELSQQGLYDLSIPLGLVKNISNNKDDPIYDEDDSSDSDSEDDLPGETCASGNEKSYDDDDDDLRHSSSRSVGALSAITMDPFDVVSVVRDEIEHQHHVSRRYPATLLPRYAETRNNIHSKSTKSTSSSSSSSSPPLSPKRSLSSSIPSVQSPSRQNHDPSKAEKVTNLQLDLSSPTQSNASVPKAALSRSVSAPSPQTETARVLLKRNDSDPSDLQGRRRSASIVGPIDVDSVCELYGDSDEDDDQQVKPNDKSSNESPRSSTKRESNGGKTNLSGVPASGPPSPPSISISIPAPNSPPSLYINRYLTFSISSDGDDDDSYVTDKTRNAVERNLSFSGTDGTESVFSCTSSALSVATDMTESTCGPVDVDDFIPKDSYYLYDRHYIILDETEFSRGLAGYEVGFEPPPSDTCCWGESADTKKPRRTNSKNHNRHCRLFTDSCVPSAIKEEGEDEDGNNDDDDPFVSSNEDGNVSNKNCRNINTPDDSYKSHMATCPMNQFSI